MAPVLLAEFELPVGIDYFLETFWLDQVWYERFLSDQLKDLKVQVGEWGQSPDTPSARIRNVISFHPSKVSFPGLASHAEVKPTIS